MRLSNHDQARRALASLVNQYRREEIPAQRFRDLVYGFGKLLEYFRFERDMAFEAEIEEIKRRLEEMGK